MVWAVLLLLGIPLWFIVVGISVTVTRNRRLRAREGNFAARVKRPGKDRWTRGNAIWISDVLVFRGSPAAWSEDLVHVAGLTLRDPSDEEQHKLRHLSEHAQIATLSPADGEPYEVAAASGSRAALRGSFGTEATPSIGEALPVPTLASNSTNETNDERQT